MIFVPSLNLIPFHVNFSSGFTDSDSNLAYQWRCPLNPYMLNLIIYQVMSGVHIITICFMCFNFELIDPRLDIGDNCTRFPHVDFLEWIQFYCSMCLTANWSMRINGAYRLSDISGTRILANYHCYVTVSHLNVMEFSLTWGGPQIIFLMLFSCLNHKSNPVIWFASWIIFNPSMHK